MDSVIVVDDEVGLTKLTARWVESIGLKVRTASDAEQALRLLSEEPAAVAICDIGLPGRDGLWLVDQLRRRYPDTAIVMATGQREFDSAVTSLRAGATDYVTKPFDRDQIQQAVRKGLDRHRAIVEEHNSRQRLQDALLERQARLSDAIVESEVTSAGALEAMLAMLTSHNAGARDHARRVARTAVHMALALGVTEPELSEIERAALLHDIGKVAMPEALLQKSGALTNEERDVMREHPRVAFSLIRDVAFLRGAADLVLSASEWFNGRGYPLQLAGAHIPRGSRVIAVSDAFDVMTHAQVYRNPVSAADAVHEIGRCAGTQFDPAAVDALQQVTGLVTAH